MGTYGGSRHVERFDVAELVNEIYGLRERICDLLRLEGLDYTKSGNMPMIIAEGMKWLGQHNLLYQESGSGISKEGSRKSAISERSLANFINHKDLATKSAYESLSRFKEFFQNPVLDFSTNPNYKVKVNLTAELLDTIVAEAFRESAKSSLGQTYTKAEEFRNVFEIYKHLNDGRKSLPENLISDLLKDLDKSHKFDPLGHNLKDFAPNVVFSPLLAGLAAILFEGHRMGIGKCKLAYDFKNSLEVQKHVFSHKPEMFFVPTYAIDDTFLSSNYIPLLLGPSTEQKLFYIHEPQRKKAVQFVFGNESNSTPIAIYKHIEKHSKNLAVTRKITGKSSGFLDAYELFRVENNSFGSMIMRGEPEACVYKRLNLGKTQTIHTVFENKTFYKNTANPCFLFVDKDFYRHNRAEITQFKASFYFLWNKLLFEPFNFDVFLINYIKHSRHMQRNAKKGKEPAETTLFDEMRHSIFDFQRPEDFTLVYS